MIRHTARCALWIILLAIAGAVPALATDYTWKSTGADINWENPANWQPGTGFPSLPGDKAIFNGTSVKDCTLSQAVSIAELRIEAGYTGKVTIAPLPMSNPPQVHQFDAVNMTGAGAWLIVKASFNTNLMNVTAGTVDVSSTPTTITCYGNWTVTGSYAVKTTPNTDYNTIVVDQTNSGGGFINHGGNPAEAVYVKLKDHSLTTLWKSTNTIASLAIESSPGPGGAPVNFSRLSIEFPQKLTVTGPISNVGAIQENPDGPPPTGGYIIHAADLLEVDSKDLPDHPPGHQAVIPKNKSFFIRIRDDDENLRGHPDIRSNFPNILQGITITNQTASPPVSITLVAGQVTAGLPTFTTCEVNKSCGASLAVAEGDTIEVKYKDNEDGLEKTTTFKIGPDYSSAATTTSITNLVALATPTTVGEAVTVSISVTSAGTGTIDGTVTVSDGTILNPNLDQCTITLTPIASPGPATGSCQLKPTTPGTKTITAKYNGNLYFKSSSASATHLVNKSSVTVAIISDNPDPSDVGQPVTVVFSVTPATASGTMTVSDGAGATCIALVPAANSCILIPKTPGDRTITATFTGSSGVGGGSASTPHKVKDGMVTITILSDDPDPSDVSQPVVVKFSLTVNPPISAPVSGTPSGLVTVSDGTGATCTAVLPATQCTLLPASAGIKTITATYSGDPDFNSTSATTTHVVNRNSTTVAIVSDNPDPSDVGQPVTVVFSVTPATASGTMTVSDGTVSCTANVPAANSCVLTPTTPGMKTITATLKNGGGLVIGAASTPHKVNGGMVTLAIVSDDPDPSPAGQAVTVKFSLTVTPAGAGTPIGVVTISDGTGATCSATLPATECTLIPAFPGLKTITATYPGSLNFNSATASASHLVTSGGNTPLPTLGPSNTLDFAQLALGGGYVAYLAIHNVNAFAVNVTAQFLSDTGGGYSLIINGNPNSGQHIFAVPALGYVQLALTSNSAAPVNGWCHVTATGDIGGTLIYQAGIGGAVAGQAAVAPSPRLRKFIIPVVQLSGQTLTGLALVNVDTSPADITMEFYGPTPSGLANITQTIWTLQPNNQDARFIYREPPFFFPAFFSSPPSPSLPSTGTVKVTSTKDLAVVGLYFQGQQFTPAPVTPIP